MGEKLVDEKCRSILYHGLPQSFRHVAKIELHESEDGVKRGIEKLRNFIIDNKYPSMDDNFLVQFLRVSKFDTKKALTRLKLYHNIRCKMADFFEEFLDVDTIRVVVEHNMVGALPFRDKDGRAIIYTQGVPWKPELCSFDSFAATFIVLGHFLNSKPITSVVGWRYIGDLEPNHFEDYYVYYKAVKAHHSMLNAIPVRIYKVHTLHDNSVCRFLYNLARPILPSFLTKRVVMHGHDIESLQQSISKEILPEEFGGSLGPINNDFLVEEFLEYVREFKIQNRHYISMHNSK